MDYGTRRNAMACKSYERIFCRYLWPAQLVYLIFALNIAKYFKSKNIRLKENLLIDVLPILVLLSPPHNSILIPMHLYLNKLYMEEEQSLEFYNFFGWCLFFNQVKTVQIIFVYFFLTTLCLHISIFFLPKRQF